MNLQITRRRALVAVGITLFHISAIATFTTYLDVQNARLEGFCLLNSPHERSTPWFECILGDSSIPGGWLRWIAALAWMCWLPAAIMFGLWTGASLLWSRSGMASAFRPVSTASAIRGRLPYFVSYESVVIVSAWSLGLAANAGLIVLASVLLFFLLALVLAVARALAGVARNEIGKEL